MSSMLVEAFSPHLSNNGRAPPFRSSTKMKMEMKMKMKMKMRMQIQMQTADDIQSETTCSCCPTTTTSATSSAVETSRFRELNEYAYEYDHDDDDDDDDCSGHGYSPPPRNPLFDHTNAITKSMPLPKKSDDFIARIAPPPPNRNLWERFTNLNSNNSKSNSNMRRIGVDVTTEFQDPKDGAAEMVKTCLGLDVALDNSNYNSISKLREVDVEANKEMEEYFASIFSFFQQHIGVNMDDNMDDKNDNVNESGEPTSEPTSLPGPGPVTVIPVPCKARIVSSIGSAGQKCPRWHVDHVPLRLIISLAGPGCIYVPIEKEKEMQMQMQMNNNGNGSNNGNNKNGDSHGNIYGNGNGNGVNRDALNGLEESDNMLANNIILPNGEENLAVYASEGDAVLLTGRAWEYEYEYQYENEYQRESKREHVRDHDHDQVQDNQDADVLSQLQVQKQEVRERERGYMPAAPHRSPDLKEDELRVLLVVDIL